MTYKCLICGRDKFTRPSPHNCLHGYRRRKIRWSLIDEEGNTISDSSNIKFDISKIAEFVCIYYNQKSKEQIIIDLLDFSKNKPKKISYYERKVKKEKELQNLVNEAEIDTIQKYLIIASVIEYLKNLPTHNLEFQRYNNKLKNFFKKYQIDSVYQMINFDFYYSRGCGKQSIAEIQRYAQSIHLGLYLEPKEYLNYYFHNREKIKIYEDDYFTK